MCLGRGNSRSLKLVGLALALASVLVSISCIPRAAPTPPAAKPEKITIPCIGDMSGPYGSITEPTVLAYRDIADFINTQRNGVDGVPIEFVTMDTGGKVDQAIAYYMQVRESKPKPLFVMGWVSGEGAALREKFVEDGQTAIWSTASDVIYPLPSNTFGMFPLNPDMLGASVDYAAETWKESRPARLAFLCWDNVFGRSFLNDTARAYIKSKGIEIVAEEYFSPRNLDLSTNMLRISEKGADFVFPGCISIGLGAVLKANQDTGSKVTIMGQATTDWSILQTLGPEVLEGCFLAYPVVNWDEPDQPAVKLMDSYFQKNDYTPRYRNFMYALLWPSVLDGVRAIELAVKDVGWGDVTSLMVKEKLETEFKDYDYPPYYFSKHSFSKTKHTPASIWIGRWENGKLVAKTGWRTAPDLRPSEFMPK